MGLALAIAIAMAFVVAGWFFIRRLRAADYATRADAELIQLLEVRRSQLAAAGEQGSEQHDIALQAMARLTIEMKQRGLISPDFFVDDAVLARKLEGLAQDRYGRSVGEIRDLAAQGQPSALYQLATLLRAASESEVSMQYLAKAADAGDIDGQFALALALLGTEDEQEPEQAKAALTWLKIAADRGHDQARKALSGLMQTMPSITVQAAFRDARRRSGEQTTPSTWPLPGTRARAATSLFSVLLPRSARRKPRE
jgi:hypothetical protein